MYTVKQAAVKLGISQSLVYDLVRLGVIPHSRHGRPGKRGCIRLMDTDIEAYRAACRVETTPPLDDSECKYL